ncbi:MAG: hypothetical protein PQJ60_04270, partial [Spirochaetales bacterium]|nr:hypothetical protein [Spirochaetales bacterium]
SLKALQTVYLTGDLSSSASAKWEDMKCDTMDWNLSSGATVDPGVGMAETFRGKISSSAHFAGEDLLITKILEIRGSSLGRMEAVLGMKTVIQGELSSSSKLILRGNPEAARREGLETHSGGELILF